MKFSYKNLWKLLIDFDMSKQELCEKADISRVTLSKMGRGENVTIKVLLKICEVLKCPIEAICEIVKEEE